MPRIIEYPYRIHAGLALPIIPITLEGKFETQALIDSGASVSVFEADIAELLGIRLENGKRRFLQGIGGRILAYQHMVSLRVADFEIEALIAFSRELDVSLNLLGQENFFEKFDITFQRAKHTVKLEFITL